MSKGFYIDGYFKRWRSDVALTKTSSMGGELGGRLIGLVKGAPALAGQYSYPRDLAFGT